ncbi:AbrB family transcriptional regulator [Streptococcus dysgalactiae subsp. equisimilis]|uniref:AbrB family transcriptional regulator n=1 Tax=Streptococcus dysgalactiae TaxID=1334 RepID=UPI001F12E66A|nr:AbrB family transcriptional regulator [Streptococcus dysgalactiae]MCL6221452.1 AbrB family transcriptional regulator [Streptococcus dysgalactiae subsp. equisimilis]UMY68992.1 AbrB family transcriptional regulator [Streptococcus dysgalactiae subsp. equisimilis]
MVLILITLLVGSLGGIIAKRLKIPAPFMIGSMAAVAMASILTGQMQAPSQMKLIAQIVSGAYIGQTVSQKDLANLPKLAKSIVSLMALFTLNMFVMGFLFHHFFGLDLVTAFLSCLPGGIMDVSLMAVDMGAKPDIVATLQSARLIGILIILPLWVQFWVKRVTPKPISQPLEKQIAQRATKRPLSYPNQAWNNMVILSVASVGGFIGLWLNIPVGALIVSLLFSAILKMSQNTPQLSSEIRFIAQILAGTLIGTSFTRESLLDMFHLIVPIMLLIASYLLINVFFGYMMYKRGILDLQSALFASSPAGATDISLLAGDLGGDMAKIAGIQISRTLYTVIVMPLLVKWLVISLL